MRLKVKMALTLGFIIILKLFFGHGTASDSCSINIQKDLKAAQPLLIKPGTSEFYYPDPSGIIKLNAGDQIELYCEKNFLHDSKTKNSILTCGEDKIENYLECKQKISSVARHMDKTCNQNTASLIEIGFDMPDERFLKIMEICYDENSETALYTYYELNPASALFQSNVDRENFVKGSFSKSVPIPKLYKKATQEKTFEDRLNTNVKAYFDKNFLARGHLAAKADFVYSPQQLATFYYINAAPQWQSFNAGNWVSVEIAVRNFATKRKLYLEVYTGTWGVATLPSKQNDGEELYLYNSDDESKLPVPKLYFKVVIDKWTRDGVVLIGVNNPYITQEEILKDYVICKDIKQKINWVNLSEDIKSGYMYACTVQSFVKQVKHLPKLDVKGVLQ